MLIEWYHKKFDELNADTLYQILKLRADVFVVEQNCVYPDLDGKDAGAIHLYAVHENQIVAYARLLAPGEAYPQAAIGRVVTHANYRRLGMGKTLMEKAIALTCDIYKTTHIYISAQLYLLHFYQNLGFIAVGESYLEDGIPHIQMQFSR